VSDPAAPRLALLLAEAEAGLAAAAGGAAVCVFTKAGTAVPGIKYHEGRRAALKEVSRVSGRTARDAHDVAAEVRRSWAEDLERLTERAAGPDWIAYRQGGLDALADLVAPPDPPA
jgi:hypothetical protein